MTFILCDIMVISLFYDCIGSKVPKDVDWILSLVRKLCSLLVMIPGAEI